MALKGINSISQLSNYLTSDILDFLTKEKFQVVTKSIKPVNTSMKTDPRFYRDLGGDEQTKYRAFLSNNELIVEMTYTDNGAGSTPYHNSFDSDDSFVEMYNNFLEWLKKIQK